MTIRYDGHGARVMDPTHVPYAKHWPGTRESPEELFVSCSCGGWEYESIASAGGGCNTAWADEWEKHIEETDQAREEREDG